MIYVVDAIMGTGKTSAAINYMNAHYKDRRFLFITPYLEEADRIVNSCPALKFACPSDANMETNRNKSEDLIKLVGDGRNVALTHELYSRIRPNLAETIRDQHYTIFIDEIVDVFREPEEASCDIDMAVQCGYLVPDEEMSSDEFIVFRGGDLQYKGKFFKDLLEMADSRRLICGRDDNRNEQYFYWLLNRNLFDAAVDTYILTYMFNGSGMSAYFELHKLDYQNIGVRKTPDGYQFCSPDESVADAGRIKDLIHVLDHKHMNAIGKNPFALSKHWYEQNPDGVVQLRRNLFNYYVRLHKCKANERLWCTFKKYESDIRGDSFRKGSVPWNIRATNKYGHTTALAFLVNIYAQPGLMKYLSSKGIKFDQEQYALSALLQWIWRSAVRNGEEVYLYIPSSRMRRLLTEWMDSLTQGTQTEAMAS